MSLKGDIKFQKTLALAAAAATAGEAEAAERAARRLMAKHKIDPVEMPDRSIVSKMNFADSALLKKLREEWRAAHPDYEYYTKGGIVRRYKHKPRQRKPRVEEPIPEGLFADFVRSLEEH
jgi:hypothetical protein